MGTPQDDYENALSIARQDNPELERARYLLERAISAGDDRAKYALATWYLFGNEIIERDEERGVGLLKELSGSNIAEALFDLAVSYDYGKVVEENKAYAFSLYMRAGLLGDKDSCFQVAEFYREGESVDLDIDLSNAWKLRSEQNEESISPPHRVWIK